MIWEYGIASPGLSIARGRFPPVSEDVDPRNLQWMRAPMAHRWASVFVLVLGVLAIGLAGVAQQSATEAPAGFETPTLAENAGSKSVSNGIAEPPGDTFALDQQIYERVHDVSSGLGPVFNGRACAECHQNPVSGGASQFTELRVGHKDANGNFVNPTIPIDDGASTIGGRSL